MSPERNGPSVSGRGLAITGITAFALFIVVLFPARLAWKWQEHRVPLLALSGIEGTVWNGRAKGASLAGEPLGTASLRWQPTALLRAQWRNHVRLKSPLGHAAGDFGWTIAGAKVAADVTVQAPLSQILGFVPGGPNALPVRVQGDIRLVLEQAVYRDGRVDRLGGTLYLEGLEIDGQDAGSMRAELRDQQGGAVAEIAPLDGRSPGIAGTALWRPSGDYRLALRIEDPALLGEKIGSLIRGLARQAEDGSWRLEWQGRL